MSKRKNLKVRTASGQLSRAGRVREFPPAQVKRLRDAAMAGLRDPEWGTELGRLYLEGTITASMYAAGKDWREKAARYVSSLGHFPVRSLLIEGRGGSMPPDPDTPEGQKRARREADAMERFFEAHHVLLSAGKLAESAVRRLCEQAGAPFVSGCAPTDRRDRPQPFRIRPAGPGTGARLQSEGLQDRNHHSRVPRPPSRKAGRPGPKTTRASRSSPLSPERYGSVTEDRLRSFPGYGCQEGQPRESEQSCGWRFLRRFRLGTRIILPRYRCVAGFNPPSPRNPTASRSPAAHPAGLLRCLQPTALPSLSYPTNAGNGARLGLDSPAS
jgi:hypothetical protein